MEMRRGRNPALTIIIVLFVVAVLIVAGTLGYFWYRKAHQAVEPGDHKNVSGSISLETPEKLETEDLQTTLLIPKATDKPGDTIKLSMLRMTVPKTWRAINGKNLLNTPLQSVYAASASDILTQLIMVPEKNPPDPTLASNSFSLYNITSWLKQTSMGSKGAVTAAMKAAYITNIQNLATGRSGDKDACNKGDGVLNITICGTLLKPTVLTSADGLLHGIAYLNTAAQPSTYDPEVYVMLTGQAKDQQLFGYGAFHLLDNTSHQLNANDPDTIAAAWEAFVNGTVPADTMQLYQHIVTAMKSLSIQVN